MVLDDTIYVVAGRSSYLDGGLRVWALDPLTGRARLQTVYSTVQDDQDDMEEGVVTDLLVRGGDSLFLRHVRIDPVSLSLEPTSAWGYGGPSPGPKGCTYLSSGQGFLDDGLFGRPRFRLEGNEDAHRLVFDEARSYSVQLSPYSTKNVFIVPGAQGYRLTCRDRSGPKGKLGDTRRRNLKKPREERDLVWDQHIPIRPSAMALAGNVLLVGGSPDVIDTDDPWAAFEGRRGGQIRAFAADHGTSLAQVDLPAPPVWDGLVVARGRVYLALTDGTVICLATE